MNRLWRSSPGEPSLPTRVKLSSLPLDSRSRLVPRRALESTLQAALQFLRLSALQLSAASPSLDAASTLSETELRAVNSAVLSASKSATSRRRMKVLCGKIGSYSRPHPACTAAEAIHDFHPSQSPAISN